MKTIEDRLIEMLEHCKKWKPKNKQEEHDKAVVLNTINYAVTGKIKTKKQKTEKVE